MRERERERETETERQRDRDRQTDRHRDRDRQTDRQTDTTDRENERETDYLKPKRHQTACMIKSLQRKRIKQKLTELPATVNIPKSQNGLAGMDNGNVSHSSRALFA